MQRQLFGVAVALLVAGCATEPVPTAAATPVPSSRVHSTAYAIKAPNTGTVVVKRDSGLAASACAVGLWVNGSLIAELRTAEMIVLHMPAGDHIAGTRSSGICFSGNSETPLTVKAGDVRTYRISIDTGGTSRLSITAF